MHAVTRTTWRLAASAPWRGALLAALGVWLCATAALAQQDILSIRGTTEARHLYRELSVDKRDDFKKKALAWGNAQVSGNSGQKIRTTEALQQAFPDFEVELKKTPVLYVRVTVAETNAAGTDEGVDSVMPEAASLRDNPQTPCKTGEKRDGKTGVCRR